MHLIGVYLMGVHLIGVHHMGVDVRRIPYGRALYRYASSIAEVDCPRDIPAVDHICD
jgi:hypothetical protein